jgi:putative transcriptional regulator
LIMKDELFAELMEAAEEALDHARGKRELRTTRLPEPPEPMSWSDVKRLRARVRTSQAVFAHYLNVSTKLVQAWEARRREPEGAALRLLRLAEKYPGVVFREAASDAPTKQSAKRVRAASRPLNAKRSAKAVASGSRAKKLRH